MIIRHLIIAAFAAFCLSASFVSCMPTNDKVMKFRIKEGKHSSNNRCMRFVKDGRMRFHFYVNPSWLYDENAPGFISGWNKLTGISEGFNQHKNSVRIGWRCINNKIYLCSYCYINGQRKISEMVEVETDWNSASLQITKDEYIITINDEILSFDKSGKNRFLLMMYPHFGGHNKAPHDMDFKFRMKSW
jgi:hypothetical protein